MFSGLNFEAVALDLQVISKEVYQGKAKDNGVVPTYYNLWLKAPSGAIGKVGCDLDTYNGVIENKSYDFLFDLNTGFEKVFVKFKAFREASPSSSKK